MMSRLRRPASLIMPPAPATLGSSISRLHFLFRHRPPREWQSDPPQLRRYAFAALSIAIATRLRHLVQAVTCLLRAWTQASRSPFGRAEPLQVCRASSEPRSYFAPRRE